MITQRRFLRHRNTVTDLRAPYKKTKNALKCSKNSQYSRLNIKVFNAVLKLFKVAELRMLNGKLFQAAGPATANALSQNFVLPS